MRSVRAAAKTVLARHEAGWTLGPSDDEVDGDDLSIVGLGQIHVEQHEFGVSLAISSTTGARDHFVELGELANEIATELGTVLDASVAAQLMEAEDGPVGAAQSSSTPLLANRVVLVLYGPDGEQLHRDTCSHQQLSAQLAGERLRPELVDKALPAVLGEEGRLAFRARTLTCAVHGRLGKPTMTYRYGLDGYGRIVSVQVERY